MIKQFSDTSATNSLRTNALSDKKYSGADKEEEFIANNEEEQGDSPEDIDATITNEDLDILDKAASNESQEEIYTMDAHPDNTDEDGDGLNESGGVSGDDLDVPGAELDDEDEMIGEEDEENNSFSENKQDDN